MNTHIKLKLATCAFAMLAAVLPSGARADIGAIKVNCSGDCNGVTLGEVCDTYVATSWPTAVACELVAQPGGGAQVGCGAANCRPFGDLIRDDLLGDYCQSNGAGQDVVVMCDDEAKAPTPGPEQAQKRRD